MKKLLGFENIGELVDGRLSQSEFNFLIDSMKNMAGNGETPAFRTSLSSSHQSKSAKGNVLGDSRNRWETVYFHYGKHWKVKARISQKEGLEITQALFRATKTGFANQRIYPLGFTVKRSYCKLGPFLVQHSDGFSVNAFYSIRGTNHFLVQGLFWDDGTSTSKLIESKPSRNHLRVVTKLDAANPRIFNNHGDKLNPDSMPIPGNKLQCDSTKPYFAFDFLARVCQVYPPQNSRWQFSLTNHLPNHNKSMPSTKLFGSIDFGKPVFIIVESNPNVDTDEKLGSMMSFFDGLPKVGV